MTRIALVGLGAAARNIHLPAYRSLGRRVELVGGCDPDAGARSIAQRLGVPVFPDARALIEQTRPDIVAVCSPPAFHREHIELALSAGCHVFGEKPLADTLEDADAIVAAAARAGRHVVVNNEFPAMRIHRAAKRVIGTSDFGRLLYLHAWHTNRPTATTEAGWRSGMKLRLGLEFGIHVFDLIRYFFDAEPSRVIAHHPATGGAAGWDPIQLVGLDFPDGRAASFVLDRASRGPERYLDIRLDGEAGSVHTSIGGQLRAGLGVHTRTRRPYLDLRIAGGGRAVLEQGDRSRLLATDGTNPFAGATAAHLASFLDALATGKEPAATAAENRRSLALVFAAQRAAEAGRAVALAEFAPRGS